MKKRVTSLLLALCLLLSILPVGLVYGANEAAPAAPNGTAAVGQPAALAAGTIASSSCAATGELLNPMAAAEHAKNFRRMSSPSHVVLLSFAWELKGQESLSISLKLRFM